MENDSGKHVLISGPLAELKYEKLQIKRIEFLGHLLLENSLRGNVCIDYRFQLSHIVCHCSQCRGHSTSPRM